MTATSHAVLGTLIAAKVNNPALAIPLALASHVLADMIPHWDIATNGRQKKNNRLLADATLDVLLGFLLSFFLIILFFPATSIPYAILLILVSQSFDWIMAPYYFFGITNPPFFYWSYQFQKLFDKTLDKPWGIINQAAVIFLAVLLSQLF